MLLVSARRPDVVYVDCPREAEVVPLEEPTLSLLPSATLFDVFTPIDIFIALSLRFISTWGEGLGMYGLAWEHVGKATAASGRKRGPGRRGLSPYRRSGASWESPPPAAFEKTLSQSLQVLVSGVVAVQDEVREVHTHHDAPFDEV